MNNPIFLAIGDLVTDAFIELENATVTCNIDHENCTISMPFGDKIPYTDVTVLRAVGNSPNAAVAAARLGLSTSLLTNIGDDDEGQKAITQLQSENIDTKNVTKHTGIKTNYHYVLRYGAERTILIKHEHYPYQFTAPAIIPDVVYLSSLGAGTEEYHNQVLAWLESNPDIILAFQPGTFQMKLGTEKLAGIYKRTNVFFCNKQEAQKILGLPEASTLPFLATANSSVRARSSSISSNCRESPGCRRTSKPQGAPGRTVTSTRARSREWKS
jgi:sugar/nucleoside kinase (ribokinase family)